MENKADVRLVRPHENLLIGCCLHPLNWGSGVMQPIQLKDMICGGPVISPYMQPKLGIVLHRENGEQLPSVSARLRPVTVTCLQLHSCSADIFRINTSSHLAVRASFYRSNNTMIGLVDAKPAYRPAY